MIPFLLWGFKRDFPDTRLLAPAGSARGRSRERGPRGIQGQRIQGKGVQTLLVFLCESGNNSVVLWGPRPNGWAEYQAPSGTPLQASPKRSTKGRRPAAGSQCMFSQDSRAIGPTLGESGTGRYWVTKWVQHPKFWASLNSVVILLYQYRIPIVD